jgi:hypothetical protein
MLQPALFSISCAHAIFSDEHARRSVEDGGLGHKSVCTTLEGMCMQAREWNEQHRDSVEQKKGEADGEVPMVENLGGVGAATKA